MLAPYRRILSVPGTAAFSAAGLLARLPISMIGLGIVLLVSARTGSYGTAGAIAAAAIIAEAAGGPVIARLVDSHGQARVALPALAVFALGVALLCLGVESDWPRGWWYVAAVIAGFAFPPWGSLVRARWASALAERRALLPTAFALEAVVDETVFVIGPVLVTALVTAVHPVAGLVSAVVLGVVGGLVLLGQRSTAPAPVPRPRSKASREPMGWVTLGPLAIASSGLGMFFGGAEVATVAFAEEAGNRGDAGWMLAVWAMGSLLAGVAVGNLGPGDSLRRFRWGALVLTATMATTPLASSPAVLAALLFGSGLAISPTLISSVALVEQAVPTGRLTEGISWMTTGLIIGVAPGAALTGATVDGYGASAAFWVPVGGGALAAGLAWTIRVSSARRIGSPGPGDQTVGESSARVRADSGRRRDA